MNTINIWKINENLDELIKYADELLSDAEKKNNILNTQYLLKFKTDINEYDYLENIVFQIASMHLNNLNISFDKTINVEFWFKNKTILNNFHLDCDEFEKNNNKKYFHPLVSCITYLNNHSCPTFISNVNYEDYKFKNFNHQEGFSLIYPNKGKHISFDGSKFHGVVDTNYNFCDKNNPRYILAINIWKSHIPANIEHYISLNNSLNNFTKEKLTFNEENNFYNIELNNNLFNYYIFEDLFYNNNNNKLLKLEPFSENYKNVIISFQKKELSNFLDKKNNLKLDLEFINNNEDLSIFLDKKNNVKLELEFINNNEDLSVNRFLQRNIITNVFTKNICNWLIFESEKFASNNKGWTTNRHKNFPTTDLQIKDIPNIYSFILFYLDELFVKISKIYGFEKEKINIFDLFIVKYQENLQNHLDFHKDKSIISLNINLSDTREFEGGGTLFQDGQHYFLEQGDLLIHCGKMIHSGVKITKGKRYILVVFLDIML